MPHPYLADAAKIGGGDYGFVVVILIIALAALGGRERPRGVIGGTEGLQGSNCAQADAEIRTKKMQLMRELLLISTR